MQLCHALSCCCAQEKVGHTQEMLAGATNTFSTLASSGAEPLLEAVIHSPLYASAGQPLVKDWGCLRV